MLLESIAVDRPDELNSALPREQCLTPQEWLLMRLYRQLEEHEQWFIRRAVEGLIAKGSMPD
ncbi:hypothetical protein [Pseudomonas gorinensis]|uniref:hypothetical protein n=1 Tax=Pseudomonas gorinensis TaxID=3240790 RepID=UPI002046A2C3|nr:MAG TPA: hypothetical protein [Caudoviricetes sp.]